MITGILVKRIIVITVLTAFAGSSLFAQKRQLPIRSKGGAQENTCLVKSQSIAAKNSDNNEWVKQVSVDATANLLSVIWANNLFIVGGAKGIVQTSPDGVTWTSRTSGTQQNICSMVLGGNKIVAVGTGGVMLTSSDNGITWDLQSALTTESLLSVTWTGSQYVAVGGGVTDDYSMNYSQVLTSTDGTTWFDRGSPGIGMWYSIAWTGSLLVAVGNHRNPYQPTSSVVFTSTDGVDWELQGNGSFSDWSLHTITWSGQLLVAGGFWGKMMNSTDGISWSAIPSGYADEKDVLGTGFTGNLYVAVGEAGMILTSQNGRSWVTESTPAGSPLNAVAGNSQKIVVVGNNGTILTSERANKVVHPNGTSNHAASLHPHIILKNPAGNNPAASVTGFSKNNHITFRIITAAGVTLCTFSALTGSERTLPVGSFSPGCYVISATSGDQRATCPFIVNR